MTNSRKGTSTTNKVAVPAKSNQLQIDLDSADALRLHGFYYHLLERDGLTKGWVTVYECSKTPDHYHCTVTMPSSRPLKERIALQALLGSHITREVYNWIRCERGAKIPVVLFKDREP